MSPQYWDIELGRAIRSLRHERNLRLTDVARMSGLSPSFISQLERGIVRASLGSLKAIGDALGTSASALIGIPERQEAGESVSFVAAKETVELPRDAGTAKILVKGYQTMMPSILSGAVTSFREYVVHAGDEFLHVLEGAIQVDLADEGFYDLVAGDSIYYRGGVRHRWRSVGGEECRIFTVLHSRDGDRDMSHGPFVEG